MDDDNNDHVEHVKTDNYDEEQKVEEFIEEGYLYKSKSKGKDKDSLALVKTLVKDWDHRYYLHSIYNNNISPAYRMFGNRGSP